MVDTIAVVNNYHLRIAFLFGNNSIPKVPKSTLWELI
jgi:hypothetical protein